MRNRVLLQGIAGSLASFGIAAMAVAAGPDVLVTDARIEAGKLVITGKTTVAGTRLRLDGKSHADFNTISGRNRAFRFDLVYLPKDCIVSLQKVQGSQLGAATEAVIANCAPSAISPRGQWDETASYEGLDLVSHDGASWLAIRDNVKAEPGKSRHWQLFADAATTDGQQRRTGKTAPTTLDGKTAVSGMGMGVNPEAAPTGPAGGALAGNYPNPQLAAGAVTTGKIGTQAVTTAKIAAGAVTVNRIANNAVTSAKIADGAVTTAKIADGAIGSAQIAPNSITFSHIQTDAVQASEIQDNSIDSGEIVDFSLTNQDVGVLFAEVNANGTLANQCSGCGVTVTKLGAAGSGNYEVDFGRNVTTACTAIATIGPAGGGSALGEVNVADRGGNPEAIFVDTNISSGTAADLPFRLVVVC